jgi:hypothetical protein
MQQKFNVGIVTFSYGGNGGISSEVPNIREWVAPLIPELTKDPRVDQIRMWNLADTPITMTRNRAVLQARQHGVDVLVMVDSDMHPDMYNGQEYAKPFFQTSFDFLVNHYPKGPCVIGAPYCGPPPNECVYVFQWSNMRSHASHADFQLKMYERHEAAKMSGIQECAALPTGLIMYDMRAFELTEPKKDTDKPWFYYEWKDIYHSDKASTEDVTQTRDLSLAGVQAWGYNPVYCNWDAWAGHWKPLCVGKPLMIDAKNVSDKLKRAAELGVNSDVKLVCLPSSSIRGPSQGDRMQDYVRLSDGTTAKLERLRELMSQAPTGPFLEIGNREGGTLLMAMEHPHSTSVTGVDPYGGAPYTIPGGQITTEYDDAMYQRMLEVARRSTCASKLRHIKATSDEFMPNDAGRYAYVFLDGSHEPDVVAREVDHFSERMMPSGIIVIDDICTLPDSLLEGWERSGQLAWRICGDCGIVPQVQGNVWAATV